MKIGNVKKKIKTFQKNCDGCKRLIDFQKLFQIEKMSNNEFKTEKNNFNFCETCFSKARKLSPRLKKVEINVEIDRIKKILKDYLKKIFIIILLNIQMTNQILKKRRIQRIVTKLVNKRKNKKLIKKMNQKLYLIQKKKMNQKLNRLFLQLQMTVTLVP